MKHFFLGLVLTLLSCFSVSANNAGMQLASEFYVNDAVVETMFAGASEVKAITYDAVMDQVARMDLTKIGAVDRTTIAPKNGEQIISIILCFFLGGIAIHRVYLGSSPMLIVWYFLTCGGVFGIVPWIDFFTLIIFGTDSYLDSDRFFSWQ